MHLILFQARACILVGLLILFPSITASASVIAAPTLDRNDLEAWLDGFLPYALASGDIAGAVVVVVKKGEVLLQKGYGVSDIATRTPVDPEKTLFRPGSVSKLFTWTAVMQLTEQGKLELDADINQYFDFNIPPRDGRPATLRQILTHTAGFEEQIRALITMREDELTPLDMALKRWTPKRIHVPGATPAYSNYATALAGYIVERVSGEKFEDYIERHIFAPLGMDSSSFRQPLPAVLQENMSKGYARASDGQAKPYEFISLAPAGSLAATGADMARFMIAHLGQGAYGDARILEAQTAHMMQTSGQATIGPLNKMMLGFYETTLNERRAIAHGGDTRWFHSNLQLFLDDGVGIFVSLNSAGRDGATAHIRNALVRGFADRYFPAPPTSEEYMPEDEAKRHAQQMAGRYLTSRRADSSLMSLAYLLGPVKVSATADGSIRVDAMRSAVGVPKNWREISPYLWQDTASSDRLAAEVVDGKVVRFGVEPYAAIMVFERISSWRALTGPLLAASLMILGLTVIAWPVSALVRRYYRVAHRLSDAEAHAQRWGRIAALLMVLVMGGVLAWVLGMLGFADLSRSGNDALVNTLRMSASVVLPAGAVLSIWNAWQALRGQRRLPAKGWALLLALASLYLLWIGIAHSVIGFGAYY